MPRKGMMSLCFNPKSPSISISPRSNSPSRFSEVSGSTTPRRSFTDSTTEQVVETAALLIMKWNPDSSTYAGVTSLFYENKKEAMTFLKCVHDLQKTMHLLVTQDSSDGRLIRAQNLMQIAMKRLQKEFYQILSTNRAYLDPESVSTRSSRASARSSTSDYEDDGSPEDDVRTVGDSISEVEQVSSDAMADLRSIAECMISSGYSKECVSIYKIIRKSIIDEGIYRLGVEKTTSYQVNKMDWDTLDLKIKNWLEAVKISMRTLFTGERILCDHVFAASDSIRESCFTEISRDGAILLFGFPELVAKHKKSPPEKMFRVLDMYTAISENWMEIESIFSFDSISTVRSQALSSLVKLSELTLHLLSEFESSIQKDSSKTPVPGADLHPLTVYAVNYLTFLADYTNVLSDIISDWPPPATPSTSLPKSFFDSPESDDSPAPPISERFARLTLVLLCKLDGKAKNYKDTPLSYLFLANNLQYLVSKAQTSNLQFLLGEDWLAKHENKVKQFAANYERLAWGRVFDSLPEIHPTVLISPEKTRDGFKKFNAAFEEAYRKQSSCMVSDPKLRDEILVSISGKIMPVYRKFYERQRSVIEGNRNVRLFVRYTPDEIGNYLSDLFFGAFESGSSPSSSVSSVTTTSSSSHNRRSRLSN
ncbi:exocyst complex component EXO70H1-like [Mercurialis annua]|uniref:exocyst complex component EXO70H1-like n=1 Tax=Mercurialis annua TaxID=3986 RepID=UPI00215FAF9D|nr:exocyst complex component EXO70H1-like [Mercurialis annua]